MNKVKRLKEHVLRNVYLYIIVSMLIFCSINAFFIFAFDLLSYSIMLTFIAMFMGQVLLLTPFSMAYPFYTFSYFSVVTISVLYWIARHVALTETSIAIYGAVIALLVTVSLAMHFLTRKRTGAVQMVPMLSAFFFGLILILGISETVSGSTLDMFFALTTVLFAITSIFGLNITYRTILLNRELRISDRNKYLRKTKNDLQEKYTSAHTDVDLLMYYLSSSLESFISGDFDRSFIDAFKIIDGRGAAFKTIHSLKIADDKWTRFRDIRNSLSHARITTEEKREEEAERKKQLQNLKELKKGLFRDTLDLLRVIRYEFVDEALKKK